MGDTWMIRDKSVLLMYSNENRIRYQEYAEFFRLIGVYVCEGFKLKGYPLDDIEADEKYNLDDTELNLVQEYINFLSRDELAADPQGKTAEKVVQVFQKYDLLQASVTLQYFCINTPIVDGAGNFFRDAAKELEVFYLENKNIAEPNYQIRYAILYCKQKANLAKSLRNKGLDYPIEDLLKDAYNLQERFPNCSNTWMLIGMICEISKEYKMQAIEALKKATDIVRGKIYSASILYRLGKNCEGIEVLDHLKNDAYERAYNVMPKYRNIYKLARQYMDMDAWDLAIRYFLECIKEIRCHDKYLDPLEQEYYFKVCSHLAYIYNKKMDYREAIRYAEQALDLKNDIYDAREDADGYDKMYYDIYGSMKLDRDSETEWKPVNIISVELQRMSSKNIYHHLAIAYEGFGIKDVADEYWSIVKR